MAVTVTWKAYVGAGPAWTDISTNTLVFCASLTDLEAKVEAGSYQDGTHLGNGDPGADQCGANHANNVKYLSSATMSVNAGGSENINASGGSPSALGIRPPSRWSGVRRAGGARNGRDAPPPSHCACRRRRSERRPRHGSPSRGTGDP